MKEKLIQIFGDIELNLEGEDNPIQIPAGWHQAVELNGHTLLRLKIGEFVDMTANHLRFGEDDLKDVLSANGHLCRSDFM
jgi:hypothetical protein